MKTYNSRDLILMRDKMSLEELRNITKATKQRMGYVDFRSLFETMGYTKIFNDNYVKTEVYNEVFKD